MVLAPEDGPIDLKLLGGLLSTQIIELGYVTLRPGQDAFSPGFPAAAIADAVEQFRVAVSDGGEAQARRALAWLLNLPDDRLSELTLTLKMAFPVRDIAQRRRFLELLWKETFADWKVEDFEPDSYELKLS
jgi:hypothetical protein